jgi:hypothetical protein
LSGQENDPWPVEFTVGELGERADDRLLKDICVASCDNIWRAVLVPIPFRGPAMTERDCDQSTRAGRLEVDGEPLLEADRLDLNQC